MLPSFSLFLLHQIFFLSFPLLPHCTSLNLLFRPLLTCALFSPFPSSQVEFCETGHGSMPCTAQCVPCQALRVQGCSPGTGTHGRGPGLCSLCSGQLAERLKVKYLGLWNQRRRSDSTCTIFAEYYVIESKGSRNRDAMERGYGMWDIISCCYRWCCYTFLNKRWF